MASKKNRTLRPLGEAELARVQGGVMLIPAVQKIRDVATQLEAGDVYIKFGDIKGDATEG